MSSHKLSNYLKAGRKRSGLSQEDIAFLLGNRKNAAAVSRFEHFRCSPGFGTAVALSVIFQKPVKELFHGDYHKVEQFVCQQARRLITPLAKEKVTPLVARKLAYLNRILAAADKRG